MRYCVILYRVASSNYYFVSRSSSFLLNEYVMIELDLGLCLIVL